MTQAEQNQSATVPLPLPTPYLARLFPELHAAADALRALLKKSDSQGLQVLDQLQRAFDIGLNVLPIFLCHPTRRLAEMLDAEIIKATAGIHQLAESIAVAALPAEELFTRQVQCDFLVSGIADWKICVRLVVVDRQLEDCTVETMH
jgi:hypothetical protein